MTRMLVLGALCAGLAAFDFGESGSAPTTRSADAPHDAPLLVGGGDASVDAMFVALAAR